MIPLAQVLRRHWPDYQRQFGSQILPSHRRAVQAILQCRTPALGGEVYRCSKCQRDHYVYHSCNHRACPQCGTAKAGQWLEAQKAKLLPVPYYLITFTVPEALRSWLRSHQRVGYSALLQQSAATLQDVARRDKYLGGELGFLSVLHTWGRQLQYHPHVHCVVPGGGLRADGLRWLRPKYPEFFLPYRVLAARWRSRLKSALAGQADAHEIPAQVWRQKWVVHVQHAGSGLNALKYLAAYVYRTALGSQRILQDQDQQITFKYQDREHHQWHSLSLGPQEFLRRFLQHVLPSGFQRIRHYGFLSPAARAKRQRIRSLLNYQPPATVPLDPSAARTCPHCGQPLLWTGTLERAP